MSPNPTHQKPRCSMNDTIEPSSSYQAQSRSSYCFSGDTSLGPVGLTLSINVDDHGGQAGRTAAQQALLLAHGEPLICAIENWLQIDWDPRPCSASSLPPPLAVTPNARLAPKGSLLHLPTEALLRIHSGWETPDLQWRTCPCDLVLDHRQLPTGHLPECLAEGDVVMMPSTFRASWSALIWPQPQAFSWAASHGEVTPDGKIVLPVTHSTQPWNPHSANTPSSSASSVELRIVSRPPIDIPLNRLMPSWSRESPYPLLGSITDTEMELQVNRRTCARGHLLRLGQGWGLRLTTLL